MPGGGRPSRMATQERKLVQRQQQSVSEKYISKARGLRSGCLYGAR